MYLSVGEISKALGISNETIRHYVQEGIIAPHKNPENNYWEYSSEDFIRLSDVLFYRSVGLSIKEIKNIMNDDIPVEEIGSVMKARRTELTNLFAAAYVNVLSEKGALNALTGMLLRKLGDKDVLIIPAFMLLFGLGGTTFGMFEETYALIPAFMVIAIALGYDRVVGGAIVFVGVATGFAAATLNPFTIGIASAVAEVDLVTPKLLAFRIVCFILFEALAIAYVMRYAKKIRKDPTKSVMYGGREWKAWARKKKSCSPNSQVSINWHCWVSSYCSSS